MYRGISIWKIGRASIGMEISSVTEPTIINLGKQCAETKEYIFFFILLLLLPLFSPVSSLLPFPTMFECTTRGWNFEPRVSTSKEQNTIPPIFLPFFFFLIFSSVFLFPHPLFPSPIFLFLVSLQQSGLSFVPETFVPRRIKAGRPEPWEIRDK